VAARGVLPGLVRLSGAQRHSGAPFADGPSLRFGLPPDEAGWQRLKTALGTMGKALKISSRIPIYPLVTYHARFK
jgi:hypothetical protein